jgi:hypothetical protein
VNFWVPEAVLLPIFQRIGLLEVRENTKIISGIHEELNVLGLLYDAQPIVELLRIDLALLCVFRSPEKTRFTVRDISRGSSV